MKVFLFNDSINTSDSHVGKNMLIAKSPNLLHVLQIGHNKY